MSNLIKPAVSVPLLTCLSAFGDVNLKKYSLTKERSSLALGAASYAGLVYVLSQILGTDGIAYTNNMWNAGTSILETAIGIYQGERFTNVNVLGAGFIIVGAYLLNQ
jgi:multidrug transporter EmrE-like cation transporter